MDKRKIIAIIEVDADVAFKAIDDGPVPYLEQAVPKIDGCDLVDAFISDDDEDDKHQAYLNYLIEWAFNHQGEDLKGTQPISYDKFCENECPCGGDSTDDCEGCPDSGDYHCVDGECVIRSDSLAATIAKANAKNQVLIGDDGLSLLCPGCKSEVAPYEALREVDIPVPAFCPRCGHKLHY